MRKRPNWSTQGLDVFEMIPKFMSRVIFEGAESDVNRLLHECIFCYITMLLYFYIQYTIHLHLIIYIWFISPSLIWMFFFHQVVSFAQVQWRYYDLPGRSSLFLRLSRWSNKPWNTVGRKKPLEERPFVGECGMDPPSALIDIWYIWFFEVIKRHPK